MNINNRQIKILEALKDAEHPIPMKQFAESFEVSIRTIQNDINIIDCFMRGNHLPGPKRLHKGIVGIEDENGALARFLRDLSKIEAKDVVMRPDERIHAVYMLLIEQRGYITVAELSEQLGVSKGTILNDLNRLRKTTQALPFTIYANSRYGIKLTGNENAVREFAVNSFMERVNASCIYNVSDYYTASICICNRLGKTRSFDDTKLIYSQLREVEDMIGKKLTDRSFLLVISGVELAVDRIKNGKIIDMNQQILEGLFETIEFKAAYKLAENLSRAFSTRFPIEEIGHIATQLLGSNTTDINYMDNLENYAEFQLVVCRLIQAVSSELNIDFSANVSLYNDLVHHIRPAVYRMKNTITLKNPLLNEIKSHYSSVFNAVKRSIGDVERLTNTELPEDEIGYITIHFASIIEKERRYEKIRPKILIVCDSGVGTSNLLTARMTSIYEVNIVDKIPYHELERVLEEHTVDYILSTVDITHDKVPVFQVSPMISDKDKLMLDPYFQRKFSRILDFDRLMGILERNCIIRDKNRLIQELGKNYLLIVNKKIEKGNDKMLKDVIDTNMIELDFSAGDWKEAVREAGRLLMNSGCVEEKYVEDMVNVVKSMGAYIVIGEGIALPHSRSAEGVHKIGISFLRLSNPVVFGHPENDPVDLLFGLSSIDNKSHIRALKDLTKMLSDEEKVKSMRKAETVDEIYSLLTEN